MKTWLSTYKASIKAICLWKVCIVLKTIKFWLSLRSKYIYHTSKQLLKHSFKVNAQCHFNVVLKVTLKVTWYSHYSDTLPDVALKHYVSIESMPGCGKLPRFRVKTSLSQLESRLGPEITKIQSENIIFIAIRIKIRSRIKTKARDTSKAGFCT